jgi:diguanylate cyclase (GGDEF)-like protein/PAS domain S-box-containing protein
MLLLPGLLFCFAAATYWSGTEQIDNSLRVLGRQLELLRSLPVAHSRGAAKEPEGAPPGNAIEEFDQLLAELRTQTSADLTIIPLPAGAADLMEAQGVLWKDLRPLLRPSGKLDAEQSRQKSARLAELAESAGQLQGLLRDRKDLARRWLLVLCASVSMLCLLMLYVGLGSVRTFLSGFSRMVETALEKTKGRLLLEAPSILTEQDIRQLRSELPVASANLGPLLEFIQQHCRNVEKILQDVPYGLLLVSGELRVFTANRFFRNQLGLPADNMVGRALGDLLPSPALTSAAHRVLQTGRPEGDYSVHFSGPHGRSLLRVSLARIRQGEPAGACLLVGVEDVTELNNARTAGQEYEELSRQFLENVCEPVILANEACHVVGLNPAAAQLLGYTKDELAGESVEFLAPKYRTRTSALSLVSRLSSCFWKLDQSVLDVQLRKKDKTEFPAQLRPRICRTGSRTYFLINIRDVSDQRRSEQLAKDRLDVLEMIAKNRPLEGVLARLTQMVEGQLADSACAVMLRRDDRLYPAAAPSLPEAFVKAIEGMVVGPKAPSCGVAAFQGAIAGCLDIAADPAWEPYRGPALEYGLRACSSVPIHSSDGTIVGTVALYSRKTPGVEGTQVELLQTASRLAAVFLEQRQLNGRLAYQAQHDALTGMANRFTFQEHMRRAIAHSRRTGDLAGLLSVDMDRFKLVNDTLGHAIGDGLLKQVAARMQSAVRETDMVARWGGDEFIVGLSGLKHANDAELVAQKLLVAMRSPFEVDGNELFLTATIGISLCPRDGYDFAELLKHADRAMYRAKNQGRDNFECYRPDMEEEAGRPLELAAHLRRALEREELVLLYQPQYELKTGRLTGLEALLRWNHPTLGMVPPARFIRLAEDTGLIVPIGAWVIEQGCREACAWRRRNRPLKIAVNVSTLQCARTEFVDVVADILDKSGVAPGSLELEMTESLIMRNVEESSRRLGRLRELGVSIAVDDFGTGYSSLSYLRRLPIDVLKIDGSFVRDIAAPASTLPLVESIVGMTRSLSMQATAEGVETEPQLSALRDIGCNFVQGYLLGKPCAADQVQPYAEPLVNLIANSSPTLSPTVSPRRGPDGALSTHAPQPVTGRQAVRPLRSNLKVVRTRSA